MEISNVEGITCDDRPSGRECTVFWSDGEKSFRVDELQMRDVMAPRQKTFYVPERGVDCEFDNGRLRCGKNL